MVRRKCDGCGGMYASRQSLFQHRKRCGKGVHTATPPLVLHTGKTTKESKRAKIHRILNQAADDLKKPSNLQTREEKNEESSDSDTSSYENEHLNSDDDEEDNYGLWESFVMACRRGDKDIFEKLEGIISLFSVFVSVGS